jgi:hypothetical protein
VLRRARSVLPLVLLLLLFGPQVARAQQSRPAVTGRVLSRQNSGPIPGLTISLAHPVVGRSTPAYTDNGGFFSFGYVPPRLEPYYLEVYLGNSLIYRTPIVINGYVDLPPIYL